MILICSLSLSFFISKKKHFTFGNFSPQTFFHLRKSRYRWLNHMHTHKHTVIKSSPCLISMVYATISYEIPFSWCQSDLLNYMCRYIHIFRFVDVSFSRVNGNELIIYAFLQYLFPFRLQIITKNKFSKRFFIIIVVVVAFVSMLK